MTPIDIGGKAPLFIPLTADVLEDIGRNDREYIIESKHKLLSIVRLIAVLKITHADVDGLMGSMRNTVTGRATDPDDESAVMKMIDYGHMLAEETNRVVRRVDEMIALSREGNALVPSSDMRMIREHIADLLAWETWGLVDE